MKPSARLPLAFVASLAFGCVGLTPPLTPPERGGAAWIDLTSKHFVLDTDLDAAEADSTLTEFEGIHSAIEDVAFPSDAEPRAPIRVVLFAREKDYRPFGPKDTAGYFTPQLPNDLDGVPTMVLWGGLVQATRVTFQHELTHLFVRRSLGWAPRWICGSTGRRAIARNRRDRLESARYLNEPGQALASLVAAGTEARSTNACGAGLRARGRGALQRGPSRTAQAVSIDSSRSTRARSASSAASSASSAMAT